MPRRQRFKPSRKPKPIVQNESDANTQQQTSSNLGAQSDQQQNESLQSEPENGGK